MNSTDFVIETISEETGIDPVRIELTSQIWYDLKISGWDLDNVLHRLSTQYSADFSKMDRLSDYVPNDHGEMFWGIFRRIRHKQYKRLRVQD
ncbi:MAG: hypothetical protein AAFX52_04890, partial [Pseudomonadota bacterium]